MCGHRHLLLTWVLCVALGAGAQDQQAAPDSAEKDTYALVLYAGGGITTLLSEAGTPHHLNTHPTTVGPSATVRLMWVPDHRLRLGFESGWTTFYSYTIDGPGGSGSVDLVGVPLLVTWSMPLTKRFSLFAGYGAYRLTSTLNYFGESRALTFSMGYAAALSYVHPLNDRVGLALEAKWMNAAETRHNLLSGQAQLVWKLHRW